MTKRPYRWKSQETREAHAKSAAERMRKLNADPEFAGCSAYAWHQWFEDGLQSHWPKAYKHRACAVRREPL